MARNRHAEAVQTCPLIRANRKSPATDQSDAIGPNSDIRMVGHQPIFLLNGVIDSRAEVRFE